MFKLNIQMQISLMIGNLYLAGLIAGISSERKKQRMVNYFNKKSYRKKENCW